MPLKDIQECFVGGQQRGETQIEARCWTWEASVQRYPRSPLYLVPDLFRRLSQDDRTGAECNRERVERLITLHLGQIIEDCPDTLAADLFLQITPIGQPLAQFSLFGLGPRSADLRLTLLPVRVSRCQTQGFSACCLRFIPPLPLHGGIVL